ncbi:MAG: hypothetical protein ACXIVL_00095 [Oceanicaulis sp.]
MSEAGFKSFADWASRAELSSNVEPHEKFDREAAARIAEKFDFANPPLAQSFWLSVTRAAHDYSRLEGVSFADHRRAHKERLRKIGTQIERLEALLKGAEADGEMGFLENVVMLHTMRLHDVGIENEGEPPALPDIAPNPIARVRFMLKTIRDGLNGFDIPYPKGRPSGDYALDVFVRQIIGFWERGLGREFQIDHNEPVPKSSAGLFVETCTRTLGGLEGKEVMDAMRRARA